MWSEQIRNKIKFLSGQSWMPHVWLVMITLLAAVLRFFKLGEWSFWIDEIYTINHAMSHYSNPELILDNIPPARNWIPVSVILTAQVLNQLGINEWSSRLTSAIIGVITVPILYFPAKRLFGGGVALVAILLLAASPWHIFWSQNARFYTSLMLLYALALFAFNAGIENNRPGYILVFHLLVYLSSSERLFAFFIIPVIVCYLLSIWILPIKKPAGFNKRILLLLFFPFIIFGIFESLRFMWLGSSIIQDMINIFGGQVNTTPVRLFLSIAYRIGLPILIVGMCGGIYSLRKKQRASLLILISAILPIVLLIFISTFMFAVDRYVFITLIFWFILAAMAIKELFAHTDGYVYILALSLPLVLLSSSLSDVFLYYQYQHGNRPDWKGAFTLIEQNRRADDLIMATRPELGVYYLKHEVTQVNSLGTGTSADDGDRIWIVVDEATSYLNPDTKDWIFKNAELFAVKEGYLPGKNLSIHIYLYDPPGRANPMDGDG